MRGPLVGTALVAALGLTLLGAGLTGVGAVLVLLALVGAVGIAVGPAGRPTTGPDEVLVPRPTGPDRRGLVAADRRLRAALGGPTSFDATVRPRLADLARDRLAHRRGVDLATDPERARDLLGEPLWAVAGPGGRERPRSARELAALLTRLEQL